MIPLPPTATGSGVLVLTLALRVFLPFALGYFMSYVFRVVNAVIAPDLVAELHLDAGALGLLTSTYFLTFAAFQLPLGILLDRFGPRRTEAILMLVAAAGAAVFALANNTGTLIIGRGLIGIGVSACLMAAFKAFVQWFPAGRLPLINGLEMAAGGVGALAATVPVEAALTITDWRGVFWGLAALTVGTALLVYLVVPERDDGPSPHATLRQQVGGLVEVMTSPVFWRVAPATFTTQASFLAVQSLWAGPWLKDIAGYDRAGVANGLLVIAIAMTAGFIFAGWVAERLGRASADAGGGRLGLQVAMFAMVGVASTIAYAVLYLLLRGPLSAFGANLLALVLTTLANTAANRRLTFGVRGRHHAVRHHVRGLVVFGIGLGVTSGALWLLHATGHTHHGAEVVVLTVANLVVTVLRFVAMRTWVFRRGRAL